MLIRFTVITSSTAVKRHVMPRDPSEKNMIKPKSVPVTKITTVHVNADDQSNHVEFRSNEEEQSAVIALSVELAKQLPRPLREGWTPAAAAAATITATESALLKKAVASGKLMAWMILVPPQHTLLAQQQQYQRILQGSNTKKRRGRIMSSGVSSINSNNNPTKAVAETITTRVSAGGNVTLQLFPDVETHSAVAFLEEQHRHASVFEGTNDSASTQGMIRSDDLILPQLLSPPPLPHQEPPPPSSNVPSINTSSERLNISVKGNPVLPIFEQIHPPPLLFDQQNKSPTSWFDSFTSLFGQKIEHDQPWTRHLHARLTRMVADLKESRFDKRISIVGVHGWFPTKLVRSMIGEPTGTSKKFCNQMDIALRQYFLLEHHIVVPEDTITIIPLEGEGKIEERVNKLYHQLLNNLTWLEAISSSDVILWGTHSQGMPVSVMLLHRLLERGHIQPRRTALCMLAMAGIGHGPFPALRENLIVKYVEASAARELFEFTDSTSAISQRFRASLAYILENDVKLVLVGSLQDQVVPLYSGTLTSISHPSILRAVYIDKHVYDENDFLINLVVFAIRLRNAGLSDHGLLIHVSEVLAGSIYAFAGGHSTIYEELDVYFMAVRYLFDHHHPHQQIPTKSQPPSPPGSAPEMEPFKTKPQLNPFHLPWTVRGIFDDKEILKESWAADDLKRLLQLFRQWTPTSARLREVKFRLEPLADHTLIV